ncbi:MAG TPA: DoxX family protein [Caulobacteraceae bacterium]|nr:DoxX family protein [Caulobacteraceae bacterium]
MSIVILLVLAAVAGIYAGRREGDPAPPNRFAWARLIAYWVFTVAVAYELIAGAWWDLLDIKFIRVLDARLGYPPYFGYIEGAPRIPFALALLLPRLPRLKEWGYAWTFFTYGGIAASEFLVGDDLWVRTAIFCGGVLVSWALRPPSRKLADSAALTRPSVVAWSVPVMVTAAMLAVAYVDVPAGGPPP